MDLIYRDIRLLRLLLKRKIDKRYSYRQNLG